VSGSESRRQGDERLSVACLDDTDIEIIEADKSPRRISIARKTPIQARPPVTFASLAAALAHHNENGPGRHGSGSQAELIEQAEDESSRGTNIGLLPVVVGAITSICVLLYQGFRHYGWLWQP
jgi:hypothetical protein